MKNSKNNIKSEPVEKDSKLLSVFYVILGIVFYPILIFLVFLKTIHKVFIKIPNTQSIGLGLFRVAVMFYFTCIVLEQNHYEIKQFLITNTFMSEEFAKNMIVFSGAILSVNLVISFLVMTGMHRSVLYDGSGISSGHENIDKTLSFREGIVSMQSTRGMVDEYAKTSFVDANTFNTNGKSENMKKAISFFDGMLGMQSTSGKYEMMKKMFGNK